MVQRPRRSWIIKISTSPSPSPRRNTPPPAVYSRVARMRLGPLFFWFVRFGRRFFFWFIEITVTVNGSEHAVDELARVFASEGLGQLHGLVDGHLGRHVALD